MVSSVNIRVEKTRIQPIMEPEAETGGHSRPVTISLAETLESDWNMFLNRRDIENVKPDGAVGWSCCDHLKKFIKSINLRANSELWGDKDSLTS